MPLTSYIHSFVSRPMSSLTEKFNNKENTTFSYEPDEGPKYYKIESSHSNKPGHYILLVNKDKEKESIPQGCCNIQ